MSEQIQQWIQWVGAIILIPALGVFFWQITENKTDIAVLQELEKTQTQSINKMYQEIQSMNNYIRGWTPAK